MLFSVSDNRKHYICYPLCHIIEKDIVFRNLEKNNLSGSIPSALVEKSEEGSLTLRYESN